jgi:molybdate transport system regulatory protein
MNVSARNVFKGKITALVNGAMNAEVELATAGGDKIVAIVTEASVQSLGLAVGKEAIAYVKAPWIMLLAGGKASVRFSARNQFAGKVTHLTKGAVNAEVGIELPGGTVIHAVITNAAVLELGLKQGMAGRHGGHGLDQGQPCDAGNVGPIATRRLSINFLSCVRINFSKVSELRSFSIYVMNCLPIPDFHRFGGTRSLQVDQNIRLSVTLAMCVLDRLLRSRGMVHGNGEHGWSPS